MTEPASLRRPWLIGLVILFVLLGAYALCRWWWRHELNVHLAAIRAAGLPASPRELDDWYHLPPGVENAAEHYLAAAAQMLDPKEGQLKVLPGWYSTNFPPPAVALPAEMRAAMAAWVATNQVALEQLHAAAQWPDCRYPVNLGRGFAATMPHRIQLRSAVRLLSVTACLRAEEGAKAEALQAVADAHTVARTLIREPTMLSQFIRSRSAVTALTATEQVVNRVSLTDAELGRLASLWHDGDEPTAAYRALVGERATTAGLTAKGFEAFYGKATVSILIAEMFYKMAGLWDRDVLRSLELHGRAIEASQLPAPASRKAVNELNAQSAATPPYYLVTQLVIPSQATFLNQFWACQARARAAVTALATQRYRQATGQLPARLNDLVPMYLATVPVDPFNGQPLRYRALSNGFVVYSLGADAADDGGMESEVGQGAPDIPFTVQRP